MTGEITGDRSDGQFTPPVNLENRSPDAFRHDQSWLEKLLTRRLVFVMGKGGVGKTTISIALACVARRFKKKVLLVELGDTNAIGRIYARSLAKTPVRLAHRIWGARVNAKAELEAYVRTHIGSGFLAGKITRSRLFDYLFEAAPGLKEVMSLGRLWRWATGKHQFSESFFDLIIVDAPATGHALSLIRLPDLLIRMIRVGPIVNQLRAVQHLLKHHQKTAIVLVTLPEELPVNETIELSSIVTDSLDMHIAAIVINCVYPNLFRGHEIEAVKYLKEKYGRPLSGPESLVLDNAVHMIHRRIFQQHHIEKIRSAATCHVHQVPFHFTNDMSLKEIEDVSLEIDI